MMTKSRGNEKNTFKERYSKMLDGLASRSLAVFRLYNAEYVADRKLKVIF
jgi:hypothetical protein